MNYILKNISAVLTILFLGVFQSYAQTCCSGGVPLSGNIGFQGGIQGSLQMELSIDVNYLATLKNGSEVLVDESRLRTTQSILLKSGYNLREWLAIDALFSYVFQARRITFLEQQNQVNTHGVGDAVLLARFILSRISDSGTEVQLGLGPKLPLGRSDLSKQNGIALNADLQPGSGSWDAITWIYLARQLSFRPSSVVSARIVGRFNGVNHDYLGSLSYSFGNSFQLYVGFGDQLLWGNQLFTPSFSLRYRYAGMDQIENRELDNTGGHWINLIPALSWHLTPMAILHIIPEIPVYSKVDGTQLTPTFRIQAGFYFLLGKGRKQDKNLRDEI